jgi:hypothetical protein
VIVEFGPNSPYYDRVNIKNSPVNPGDSIVCVVTSAPDLSSGNISMANRTNNKSFSIALQPPLAAQTVGGSVEWIMERPTLNGTLTVLAQFTPVISSNSLGCGPAGAADPTSGESVIMTNDANEAITAVALSHDQVTIQFTG